MEASQSQWAGRQLSIKVAAFVCVVQPGGAQCLREGGLEEGEGTALWLTCTQATWELGEAPG